MFVEHTDDEVTAMYRTLVVLGICACHVDWVLICNVSCCKGDASSLSETAVSSELLKP